MEGAPPGSEIDSSKTGWGFLCDTSDKDSNIFFPPEVEEGNIEYKLKLVNPTAERFQQLVTQLKWRLSEGNGEAIYELGVSDKGLVVGISDRDLHHSMETLRKMSNFVNAEICVVRERTVFNCNSASEYSGRAKLLRVMRMQTSLDQARNSCTSSKRHRRLFISTDGSTEDSEDADLTGSTSDCGESLKIAEVLVRRLTDDHHFLEIRIAFLGDTNSGKSTLLGYLSQGELDNGKGKARLRILRHRHEVETGLSSSISHTIIGFDAQGALVNGRDSNSAMPKSYLKDMQGHIDHLPESTSHDMSDGHIAKVIMLIDTCGHKKFLDTTIHGISGYRPDYACLVIDGNSGTIELNTKEVLGCAIILSVPVFVVITKIDLTNNSMHKSNNILKSTLEGLTRILMQPGLNRTPFVIQNENDVDLAAQNFENSGLTPIFLVSNVTGENLDLLIKFFNALPPKSQSFLNISGVDTSETTFKKTEFQIEEIFTVPDIGTVVGGRLLFGQIERSHIYALGPINSKSGRFIKVQVTSIHRQRRPVKILTPGHSATLALRDVQRDYVRKGMVILEESAVDDSRACMTFEALMYVLYSPKEYEVPCVMEAVQSDDPKGRKRSYSCARKEGADRVSAYVSHGIININNISQRCLIVGAKLEDSLEKHASGVDGTYVKQAFEESNFIHLHTGQKLFIQFQFCRRKEYLTLGSKVIYRESNGVKMIGEISRIYH